MITAVDTSILLDIFGADRKHGQASANTLKRCLAEGALAASEVVWTEITAALGNEQTLLDAMDTLGIGYSPILRETALAAGATWRTYHAGSEKQGRGLPDFLIGAHALMQCDRLLTRDRRFYRQHFEKLIVLDTAG